MQDGRRRDRRPRHAASRCASCRSNGRNFLQLTLLQPGVTANEGLNTVNKGLLGGSDISVSGGSTTSNMWLVDGANNNDDGSNRTILVYPSVDAIEEFKIQRNNYGAEFGQAGGAQINIVTRGGTNDVPRQRLLLRPPRLPELDELLPGAGRAAQGAAEVGRLRRDLRRARSSRTSCTSSSPTRRTRTIAATSAAGFVPTAAERAGDFSGAGHRRLHAAGPDRSPHGPAVPRQRASRPTGSAPPAWRSCSLYPLPEQHAELGLQQLRRRPCTRPSTGDQINARVDWTHQQQHPR